MGNLYDSIRTGCQTMKTLGERLSNLLAVGGFFQLWIVASFEKQLQFHTPPIHNKKVKKRRTEGV